MGSPLPPTSPALSDVHTAWLKKNKDMAGGSGGHPGATAQAAPTGPPTATVGPEPLQQMPTGQMSAVDMPDEDIAASIMDKQYAILLGWQTALTEFDTTMTSAADAEATPDFQKALGDYAADKVMGFILSKSPGTAEIKSVLDKLAGEAQRAAAAGASAKLRDFVLDKVKVVGSLMQTVMSEKQGFISAIKARREAYEKASAPPPSKGGGKNRYAAVSSTQVDDDYAMMRMGLMDALDKVEAVLKVATYPVLFRELSEEWMANQKVRGGMGVQFPAKVIIRLNPNYSIKDVKFQGNGGQKIAEEMLKDFPNGVDVLSLKTPKAILLMADNGWPSVTLSLDAANHDKSTGSFGEGDTDSLYKYVLSKGLPLAKQISGD